MTEYTINTPEAHATLMHLIQELALATSMATVSINDLETRNVRAANQDLLADHISRVMAALWVVCNTMALPHPISIMTVEGIATIMGALGKEIPVASPDDQPPIKAH